jgi:AcrR family transcriptional regulator
MAALLSHLGVSGLLSGCGIDAIGACWSELRPFLIWDSERVRKSNLTSGSCLAMLARMTEELRVPVQARSVRTRGELIASARQEFSAQGYALTTAKTIAANAGVGTGTFYHYFPDKDALLRVIVAERIETLERSLVSHDLSMIGSRADPRVPLSGSTPPAGRDAAELRRRVRKDIDTYLDYHRADRGLHAVISERRLCDAQIDAIMSEVERRGVRRTALALAHWGFAGDAEAAAFMIFSLLDGAVHNHVLGQPTLSDARFVEALSDAILLIGMPSSMLLERDAR